MSPPVRFTGTLAAIAIAGALAAAAPIAAVAQVYTIPWSNLDGGGSPATPLTGGAFSLSASLGQSDAGSALTGGSYSLRGGFWAGPVPRLLEAGPPPSPAMGLLSAPWPNPFSALTEVSFSLATEAAVRLEVYDVAGQRVRSLLRGTTTAGAFHVHWNGAGDDGQRLPSGMYFIRLDAPGLHSTRRAVLVH